MRIIMYNKKGIYNFDMERLFPLTFNLGKLQIKNITEDIIIGDGIFRLGIEQNNNEIITQKDARGDLIAMHPTISKNIILAIEPIFLIEQKQIQKYKLINSRYSIFCRINFIILILFIKPKKNFASYKLR